MLIVERDAQVRELQEFFLTRAGYTVRFADNGEAALALAAEISPSVVLTEILIPVMDGLMLCRRLRAGDDTRHIPVIVFSILSAASRAGEAGASAFLRKPLIESVFLATVHDVIAAKPPMLMEQQ